MGRRFGGPGLGGGLISPDGARGLALAALSLALGAGCDSAGGAPGRDAVPAPDRPPPSMPSAAVEAAVSARATPRRGGAGGGGGAGLPAAALPGAADLAGPWEGRYDAKKGSVELPPRVKDKTHDGDDGTAQTGPGTLRLTVSPEGEIRGRGTGALGNCTLAGRAEGGMVRITVFPDDSSSNNAMTGVLVGALKEGVIKAELRVAGPDARVVRESPVELRRK